MGVDSKRKSDIPPLPAPTETELTSFTATDLATDVSRSIDEKSSYSLPEDGTPVTLKARGHKSNRSQTSLLIEYFEGGKPSSSTKSGDQRKPSVRVRLTPSRKNKGKGASERDHIQITETKPRKASLSRRSTTPTAAAHRTEAEALSALSGGDLEDMSSYASATEESNVSRNPIDIEIDRGGHGVRRRRPASPLIPAADSSAASYQPQTMSEISDIPTNSFFDGSGPTTSFRMSDVRQSRSGSPSRAGDMLAGAAAGLTAAAAADKLRTKSRDRERDKITVPKSRDKDRSERKSRSGKSRSGSGEKDRHTERSKTPRKRSSGGHHESTVSAADSSVLSSGLSPSRRSADQHSLNSVTSKASSINNPKLLETVEDVIRRLILPELNALKREQSKSKGRRDSATSSATSISRDDHGGDRRRSSANEKPTETPRDVLKKERRDREARNDFDYASPPADLNRELPLDQTHDIDQTPKRSSDRLQAAAAGGAIGMLATAAAMGAQSPSEEKRTRRRRRAELRNRSSDQVAEDYGEPEDPALVPPMPLMSEINPSDVTRASILSADTDRPRSASEELTPVQQVSRGVLAAEPNSPTPTGTPRNLQESLGTQHANISHGDLKELPRRRTGDFIDESADVTGYGQNIQPYSERQFEEDDYDDNGHDMSAYSGPGVYDYYNTQDVPPPLKYEPYQPERRGLSPIQSVSEYAEGGSEAPNRDSRVTHTSGSVSPPDISPRRDAALRSPSSVPSNILNREFGDDESSVRSPGLEYRNTTYTDDSEFDHADSGQAVRAIGANPEFVHPSAALESNVASLVDGSMLEDSVITGESGRGGNQAFSPRESMETLEEERAYDRVGPAKRSAESHRRGVEDRDSTSASGSLRSRGFMEEYEVDDYGNKVPRSKYRQSPTASEAAITVPAAIAAAAALKAAQGRGNQPSTQEEAAEEFVPAGVQRNQSFKERTMNGRKPLASPTHSADRMMDDFEQPKMGFHAIPNPNDPMPEIGTWHEDEAESVGDNHQPLGNEQWQGDATPRQQTPVPREPIQYGYQEDRQPHDVHGNGSGHGLGLAAAAAGAAAGAAMAHSANHSRQPSQEQVEEWHRTSDDRKRDTLLTNPYEGTSPIVNLPGLNDNLLGGGQNFGPVEFNNGYAGDTSLGHKVDEGYISQGPNKTPDLQPGKGKGVVFDPRSSLGDQEDPFYAPQHTKHLSGMSQGMASPFYDGATGAGIDRIESKDIIALMQHMTVRDAQRSARDTEILVTLVRSAAEMRNSFEDIKRLLADTEDVVITEVKDNTEKTVQRAIGGPRPFPGSGARSLQGGSQAGTTNGDDLPAKKRNLFRRALKGLSAKGTDDLGRIEDMLMQLLTEVDVLKTQTAPGAMSAGHQGGQSVDNIQLQPGIPYDQDHGYEPEGNAGTSTTSHASQSGHLSIPQSRGASVKLGYDRKFSDHRISTVPEANEDDYNGEGGYDHTYQSNPDMLMTPACEPERGGSVPLGTPPHVAAAPTQASLSNDNTPRTEKGKKHKSSSSSSWFPKISRWSETTTSSVAQAFRRSGQARKSEDDGGNRHGTVSRSGSDLALDDGNYQLTDPYGEDKLHTGFSEPNLVQEDPAHLGNSPGNRETPVRQQMQHQPPPAAMNFVSMTPEDPKYKAHRNSLNLQHPQPRPGQTDLFKAALESQAHDYDSPRSPRSADWAGSATSLQRLPRNANRDSYGSATEQSNQQRYWTSSPAAANVTATAGPPRPPKEPLEFASSPAGITRGTPPKSNRISKLQKQSPLPYHSVESGYGTMTHGAPSASYVSHAHTQSGDGHSPRLENRNLSGALGVPTRRPSGPRAMTPKSTGSMGSEDGDLDRRRKRDTFGTIGSQDTDTF